MTSLGGVEPCACSPAWPALVVHTDDGRRIDVVPAATPGGLACLYEARCARCGLTYPGPFRVPPRAEMCARSGPGRRGGAATSTDTAPTHGPEGLVTRARARSAAGRFIQRVRLAPDTDTGRYPFTLPAVAWLARSGELRLGPGVTFLVGENGTGKSTLVEALAVAAGFNPEGGSQNFRFATRATESSLGDSLILTWGTAKPRTGFFLRAESYYNVASESSASTVNPVRRCSRPTAASRRTSAPTASPLWIW